MSEAAETFKQAFQDIVDAINRVGDRVTALEQKTSSIPDWAKAVASKELLAAAVRQHSIDMHHPSDRPCGTCEAITRALGEPFGCYHYQARKRSSS